MPKLYQNLEQVTQNNRTYIKVRKKNTYSPGKTLLVGSQKEALGFHDGYITIFKGDTYSFKDWFKKNPVTRYTRWWGWYVPSNEAVPENLPEGITPVRLNWNSVGNEDGKLKPEDQVKKIIEPLIYDIDENSAFVGEIGDRLELAVTIQRNIPIETNYGVSNMHIMTIDSGETFVWTTQAKNWETGSRHHIRGTVKDHRIYHGKKETILTRCREVIAARPD